MGASPRRRPPWPAFRPLVFVLLGAALVLLAQFIFRPAEHPGSPGTPSRQIVARDLIVSDTPSTTTTTTTTFTTTSKVNHPMSRLALQMPFYIRCFRSPKYTFNGHTGECSMMHTGPAAWLTPTEEFRQGTSVVMDSSRCMFYLERAINYTMPEAVIPVLGPKTIELRSGSTDHDVFLQVSCGGDFDFLFRVAYFVPTDRPVTVLDGGANIGLASLLFAQLIQARGEVLAVDANPETTKLLERNVLSMQGVVKPVLAAIVNETTAQATPTLTLSGDANQYWGYRVDHSTPGQTQSADRVTYSVKAQTLKQLRDQTAAKRFDLIKLDIEGEERHIFGDEGSQEVLCEAVCLFMELHERFEPGCEAAFNGFMERGCSNGVKFMKVAENVEYIVVCQADHNVANQITA